MTSHTSDVNALREKIAKLKKDLNAIILAHNYQRPEVQDIADITGDSLELSRAAAKTDYDVIVFCGVHFMAESASILSPDKTVLLPGDRRGLSHGRHGHGQRPAQDAAGPLLRTSWASPLNSPTISRSWT